MENHHIMPSSVGGTNDKENLMTLCANCHRVLHKIKKGVFEIGDKTIVYTPKRILVFSKREYQIYSKYLGAFNRISIGLLPESNPFDVYEKLILNMARNNVQ